MSTQPVHLCCLLPVTGPHADWCVTAEEPLESRQQRRAKARDRAHGRATHQIDQAHADALSRLDQLLKLIALWQNEETAEDRSDALNNSMVFFAIVKIMEQQVAVTDLPYLLSAAILTIAQNGKGS